MTGHETANDKAGDHQELRCSECVLNARDAFYAEEVDHGKQRDQRGGDDPSFIRTPQRRIEIGEIIGTGKRRSGDRPREAGEERNPARHESPCGTEGASQINVFASGAGKVDAELGITQGSAQREQRAGEPYEKNRAAIANITYDKSRSGE